jgi:hypothetical protein
MRPAGRIYGTSARKACDPRTPQPPGGLRQRMGGKHLRRPAPHYPNTTPPNYTHPMNPIRALVTLFNDLAYRHERIEKPGVGSLHTWTNRITRRIAYTVAWPDDNEPFGYIEIPPKQTTLAHTALSIACNAAYFRRVIGNIAKLTGVPPYPYKETPA